ncbi:1-phosphofructokinase family hexose kinase [Traorella massiliensis]|uniref:1-phosphofructokinase family hexose kinase n=2 Tax=Bacteria TaxID=2 RepID=UPI0008F94446|nr:1-phosphofructokinase family hexose kinase [Traorella massiliensis]
MIYTCTLNPALDKMGYVEKIQLNQMNRLTHIENDAGGKGINVSRDIKALNHKSVAVGFLGGSAGTFIEMLLRREDIDHHMIEILGNTRTNLKVFDENGVSEFNEEGPFVLNDELEALLDFFRSHLDERCILVISGSMPKGCGLDTYKRIIEIAKENEALVFLDTSMKYLLPSLEAHPDIVKITSADLAKLNHIDARLSEEEIASMGRNFIRQNCEMLCVSHENQGIYLITKNKILHCTPMDLEIKSKVGVGDAFVAGFVVGLENGLRDEEVLRLAGASYAAASQRSNAHPKNYEEVHAYLDQIIIERV